MPLPSVDYTKEKLRGDLLDAPDADAAAKALLTSTIEIPVAAAATPATPLAEGEWVAIPFTCEVLAAYFCAGTGVAAAAADTGTIVLSKFAADGTGKTTVASRQTITGNAIVAKAGWPLTVVNGAEQLVQGGCLAVEVTKQASGVATPAGKLVIVVRRRGV
jgi:hypothetical protein